MSQFQKSLAALEQWGAKQPQQQPQRKRFGFLTGLDNGADTSSSCVVGACVWGPKWFVPFVTMFYC